MRTLITAQQRVLVYVFVELADVFAAAAGDRIRVLTRSAYSPTVKGLAVNPSPSSDGHR